MAAEFTRTKSVAVADRRAPFILESGNQLEEITVAYETYGKLSAGGDNAILVCHALTGNAHAGGFSSDDPKSAGWWEPMIGPGRGLDTDGYFVVCSNILGSCYGTTGPCSINPSTGVPYGISFPQMTVRDIVRVQREFLKRLGVTRLITVIGGSLGGMQALEWACMEPEMVASVIPIGTAAKHSPWCIGLNDAARQAIMNDPGWYGGAYPPDEQPRAGLSLARQIAMISYRSDRSFLRRFGRDRKRGAEERFDPSNLFQIESYLRYQGEKLVGRFDANSYLYITRAMDLHDVGEGRGGVRAALGALRLPTLCIGIASDVLYPVHEQKEIADMIPGAAYREIVSDDGHDAFLIETEQMVGFIKEFLREHRL